MHRLLPGKQVFVSVLLIVTVVLIVVGVVLFVLKGPDLGSAERGEGRDDPPGPFFSQRPASVGGGNGGAGGAA